MAIPKIMHFVWIGDESREPVSAIESWRRHHPDFDIRVHRNAEALSGRWRFARDIETFHRLKRYPGAADLMRWELLYETGGIALDADSACLRPLPDWLLDCALAACWDNSVPEGDLLSNGFVLAEARDPTIGALIDAIASKPIKFEKWSWSRMAPKPYGEWQTTGPVPFTDAVKRLRPSNFTALPSHFLIPRRRDGVAYDGGGPVFADQIWSSTQDLNEQLDDLVKARLAEQADPPD